MSSPKNLRYTKSHEWIRVDGKIAYVGITDYAQDSLGDIVYIELPETGRDVSPDEELTTIESVKAAEPIFAPIAGKLIEVNGDLEASPEKVNTDPYGSFLFALEIANDLDLSTLLSAEEYDSFVAEEQNG